MSDFRCLMSDVCILMGFMVVITLLIFYALGVAVFHATSVQILPGVALLVLTADRWLVWKYSGPEDHSTQS